MKLDLHVHTHYSGNTTIYPLNLVMKESFNSPEGVYRRAKAPGMDLVTIADHDRVDDALTIADRSDVIVGCDYGRISRRRSSRPPGCPEPQPCAASRDSGGCAMTCVSCCHT